jgi:hypothetical protein
MDVGGVSDTWSVTTAAPPAAGDYGFIVFGPDGTTEVLSTNVRATNLEVYETFNASGGNVVYSVDDANDSSKIIIGYEPSGSADFIYTTSSTAITITSGSGTIIVVRIA